LHPLEEGNWSERLEAALQTKDQLLEHCHCGCAELRLECPVDRENTSTTFDHRSTPNWPNAGMARKSDELLYVRNSGRNDRVIPRAHKHGGS
jgi:hypothetical protein